MLSYIWLAHICAHSAQPYKWNALQQIKTDVNASYRQHSNISSERTCECRCECECMCASVRSMHFGYNLPYYLRFFHSKLVWKCRFCCKTDSSINYCSYSYFCSFFILLFFMKTRTSKIHFNSLIFFFWCLSSGYHSNDFHCTSKTKSMSSSSDVLLLLCVVRYETSGNKIEIIASNSLPLRAVYRELCTFCAASEQHFVADKSRSWNSNVISLRVPILILDGGRYIQIKCITFFFFLLWTHKNAPTVKQCVLHTFTSYLCKIACHFDASPCTTHNAHRTTAMATKKPTIQAKKKLSTSIKHADTKIYGSWCWCQSLTIFDVLCTQRRLLSRCH